MGKKPSRAINSDSEDLFSHIGDEIKEEDHEKAAHESEAEPQPEAVSSRSVSQSPSPVPDAKGLTKQATLAK